MMTEAKKAAAYAKNQVWRKANPDKVAAYALKHRGTEKARAGDRRRVYGTDGLDLLKQQDGKCAICEIDLADVKQINRHLDHCHETGRVRGWLCHGCNTGLARFGDNVERVAAALDYLRRHRVSQ